MKRERQIRIECPRFFSRGDESGFFSRLESLKIVQDVRGVGPDLEITFSSLRVSQHDLRELLALFHRYRMDKRELRRFDRPELTWFRDPKAYWRSDVFGNSRKR